MTQAPAWSPIDFPFAAALNEANACFHAVRLCAERLHAGRRRFGAYDARQLDARHLVMDLRQLLYAHDLMRSAVKQAAGKGSPAERVGVLRKVRKDLNAALARFHEAVPDAVAIRDVLVHMNEYARGTGGLQRESAVGRAESAAAFWVVGYSPAEDRVTVGPHGLVVSDAVDAAQLLVDAIHEAGRAAETCGEG